MLKNKFSVVLIVFLLIIFVLTSNIFAKTDFDDDMYYPDGVTPNYVSSDSGLTCVNKVLYKLNDTYYILIICNNGVTHDTQKLYMSGNGIYCTYSGKLLFTCSKYDSSSNTWSYFNYWDTGCGSYSSSSLYNTLSSATIVSTSSNIYTDNTFTEIFFTYLRNRR